MTIERTPPAPTTDPAGPAVGGAPVSAGLAPSTRAETSGVTTMLILGYVRQRAGDRAVEEVLRLADVPESPAQLENEAAWCSYDTRIRLFEAATTVLGDPRTPRSIGAEALRLGLNHSLVLLLRALGSPWQVYRQLPRSVPKFSTTSTMEVLEHGAEHATIRFRLHDGYRHSRLDCAYAQGLIATVPEIFGLPPARILHEECQSDGHPACLYHVTWSRRRGLLRRRDRRGVDPELVALRGQLEQLQSTAAEMVDAQDVDALLQRITDRAATAVLAPAYVLALHGDHPDHPDVRWQGVDEGTARALARDLLEGGEAPEHVVAVDIASRRRRHGYLAAVYAPGQRGPADERALLRAHAAHAAAALELVGALDASRRGEDRAEALLRYAHQLRAATELASVARVTVDVLPQIAGCDSATIFSWDPQRGVLVREASSGLTPTEAALIDRTTLSPATSPSLAAFLVDRRPFSVGPGAPDATVTALREALGLRRIVVAPLLADDVLLGMLTAGWRDESPGGGHENRARLRAVADFASTALQNARLLQTVRHQSMHDDLTGLPNRATFRRALQDVVSTADRAAGVAVLFCDLDGFKNVNDSYGHAAGDELLRQVALRMRAVLDAPHLLGRLSGDEFAVVLRDVPTRDVVDAVAGRVVAAVNEPFHIEGHDLRVTVSIGVACLEPSRTTDAESLLQAADAAMYRAKGGGSGVAHAEISSLAASAPVRPAPREGDLRRALGDGEIAVHYQPIVRLGGPGATVRTTGLEALVRWQHPTLGLLAPAAFLPLAERTGLMADLDLLVVARACADLARWSPDGDEHVAVNVSPTTLLDPRVEEAVRRALADVGLDARRLVLEVVESRSLSDLPGVVERLAALRQLGLRVSLDDFGTGFSTLSWLHSLPVDQVKLDRSFVQAVTVDARSGALIRGVLAMAEALGLDVVAEGVETTDQAVSLEAAGCPHGQGYLWGRPVALDELAGIAVAARVTDD